MKTTKILLASLCFAFFFVLLGCNLVHEHDYTPNENDYSTVGNNDSASPDFDFTPELSEEQTYEFLTYTIYAEPVGMQGFEDEFALDYEENPLIMVIDDVEFVEIIVQFRTPSQVALELADDIRQGRGVGNHNARYTRARRERRALLRTGDPFEQEALSAHDNFEEQMAELSEIIDIRLLEGVYVISEHHLLFNGLYLRVPIELVEFIADLPEVYAVFPHILPEILILPEDVEPIMEGIDDNDSDLPLVQEESNVAEIESGYLTPVPNLAFDASRFVPNTSNFMSFTREYLGIDTLNNLNGTGTVTGAGVRVGVIDSGIDHNHPRFAQFRDNTGRIRGWNSHNNTASPDASQTSRNHGTTVSGALIGIAPGIELWNYRINVANSGVNEGNILNPTSALERAIIDGMDIVNISFGNLVNNHPFVPFHATVNTAVLNGMIVVVSAGNSGSSHGVISLTGSANSSLSIAVASAQRGGQSHGGADVIRGYSSLGPIGQIHHIGPDLAAPSGVVTTNLGGGYVIGGGTSHAAPIIAGVAALILQQNPTASPAEVRARMMTSSRPMSSGTNASGFGAPLVTQHGSGMVQPLAAINPPIVVTTTHAVPLTANPATAWSNQTMPSFSFGELRAGTLATNRNTINANIRNSSNISRTINMGITGGQCFGDSPVRATISRNSVTLAAGASAQFSVTMSVGGAIPNNFYGCHVHFTDAATGNLLGRTPILLVNQTGTANVNASHLSFSMGTTIGYPATSGTPTAIWNVYINHGTLLQLLIQGTNAQRLPAFRQDLGGMPQSGGIPAPTRTGHTFNGWGLNGCTNMINASTTMPATTATIHACWTPLTRTVTFNPQGGTWPAPLGGTGNATRTMSQTATSFSNVLLTATSLWNPTQSAPTRAGYTFAGWFTAATGGTQQTWNSPVTPGAGTITLHAQWTQHTRTVSFNTHGGTAIADRTMAQSATNYATIMNTNNLGLLNPAANAPTRAGYTFAGWFTAQTGGTRVNHNTNLAAGAGTITLHAQWTPLTRIINFNSHGGTAVNDRAMPQSASNFATVMNTNNLALLNPAANAPTRAGYTFAGWFTTQTAGTRINHNSFVTPGGTALTLHAQWIPSTRTINFNTHGGTAVATRTMSQQASNFATVMNTNNLALLNPAANAPTRVGYTFAGWFTAQTFGTRINHNSFVTPGSTELTLHAQWTPIVTTRTVTFNPQGGTWPGGGTGNLDRTMNQNATNLSTVMNSNNLALINAAQNPPTRPYYMFVGWYTAAVGGTRMNHNSVVTAGNTPITLHARWVSTVPTAPRPRP